MSRIRFGSAIGRREFLRHAGLATAAALVSPETLLADPYAPLPRILRPAAPVRVRGRVISRGRGVRNVSVTDGLSVVRTDADGRYELVTTTRQRFVYLSVPSGYRIPVNETGTARFYQPIQPDRRGEMNAIFQLEPLETSDENHAFFLLADPQTQNAYEMELLHSQTVPDLQGVIKQFGDTPLFGVSCGDIMFDDLSLFPDYERAVSRIGIPFFQVVGNHDLVRGPSDGPSTATFERHFGPSYYSFNRGRVHYVVLDDVFWYGPTYLGYITDEQLAWLEADLQDVERGSPVVVFVHIPLLCTQHRRHGERSPRPAISVGNREALYRLLEPFQAHVLSGHTHETEHVFEGGVQEHVHGTVCGAWWSGPICHDGTPNGYGIYEVRGEELRWQYKGTGLDVKEQLRVYPRGADPKAPDEIVANVWNWDPEWKVILYEDGQPRGAMERRLGLDPLSVELHSGSGKPERRPWVEPMPNEHLFYARVSPTAREVRVEATDRWGRTYTAVLTEAARARTPA